MKISKETLTVLKNFSTINSNLLLLQGNKISTLSFEETLVGYAEIQEDIPSKFGIYDLSEFLGALSLFEDPDLEFNNTHIKIKNQNHSIKYFSAEESLLKIPVMNDNIPGIVTKFPKPDITFNLSQEQLTMILKTAAVLKSSDLSITGDGSRIVLVVGDKKNSTANKFRFS